MRATRPDTDTSVRKLLQYFRQEMLRVYSRAVVTGRERTDLRKPKGKTGRMNSDSELYLKVACILSLVGGHEEE